MRPRPNLCFLNPALLTFAACLSASESKIYQKQCLSFPYPCAPDLCGQPIAPPFVLNCYNLLLEDSRSDVVWQHNDCFHLFVTVQTARVRAQPSLIAEDATPAKIDCCVLVSQHRIAAQTTRFQETHSDSKSETAQSGPSPAVQREGSFIQP